MKRTLLLLSLFAVPGMLTSCKDEAATPAPDNTSSVAEVTKSAPEPAAEVSQTAVFHPDKLCHLLGFTDSEIKIIRAGYTGDTATLDNLKDKNHIGIYCFGAAAAGKKELVLQCLDKGAYPDYGLWGAALGGHMDIVQLMLDKGATDYNLGLERAALGGHMDIVQLMLDKGATDYDWGLWCAAEGGHMDIVQLLLSKGATDYNRGLKGAAEGGHMDIVQLMLSKGATDYNDGLCGAAWGGHMDIVQLMLDKGADPNKGLLGAATGGHVDIVQLMLDKGATNLDSALQVAESWGNTECAELIRAAMKK